MNTIIMIDTLLSQLTSQLGVSDEQARGGAGALFAMAQEKLGGDFTQISESLPGLDGLISQAPTGANGEGGGLLGAAAGLLGGGEGALGKLGDLAGLASTFKGLGLDSDQIGSFGEIIMRFVKEQLGDQAAGLLSGLLK